MQVTADLVGRIEHSAADVSRRQAAAIAAHAPESGAVGLPCDGGALIAFGPGRYVNRAQGVGLGGTPAEQIVDALDSFYGQMGMAPSLELCPWAAAALLQALRARGYQLERFRNVYAHDLEGLRDEPDATIEVVCAATRMAHKAILSGGAEEGSDARRISDEYCDAAADLDGAYDLVAMVDGSTAACGSLAISNGVGWLGGAATSAEHRGCGLQGALIDHRLLRARAAGCHVAAATALHDGQSARNLSRLGFTLLYTQAVLTRPA